jgi:SAM-dependent methyltransferase
MSEITQKHDFVGSYNEFIEYNFANFPIEKAVEVSCGGNREAYGHIEKQILIKYGANPQSTIVDVGCGYGRLAENLVDFLSSGTYLGVDVVPKLIDYARNNTSSSDKIKFEVGAGLELPPLSEKADIISVFSVFTHMLHEDSYVYLENMKKSLKDGGKIIISFLEFSNESHWPVFYEQFRPRMGDEPSLLYQQGDTPRYNPGIMFTERPLWIAFAKQLNLKIVDFVSGYDKSISLEKELVLDNGDIWKDFGSLGQSLVVLEK